MAASSPAKPELLDIPLGKLDPDPHNPRKRIEVDDEFVQSIAEHGILEPIVVVPGAKDGRYTIAFGERRYTGAKKAKLKTVPCIVRHDLDEVTRYEQQVVENLHRAALTPLEEAAAYVRLVTELGVPQRELVSKVGRSQSYLSKHMALVTRLHEDGQTLLDSGGITVSDAILLASLHDDDARTNEVLRAYALGSSGHYSGPEVLKRAVEDAKREKASTAARKKLTDAGVTLVDRRPNWAQLVGPDKGIDVEVEVHAKEPCHVAHVDEHANTYWGCSDPDRHTLDGASNLKASRLLPQTLDIDDDQDHTIPAAGGGGDTHEDWRTQMERQRAENERVRAERLDVIDPRRALLRKLLADNVVDATFLSHQLTWIAADWENGYVSPDTTRACDLLGLDVDEEAESRLVNGVRLDAAPQALVAEERDRPTQVGMALALSVAEALLGANEHWNDDKFDHPVVRAHVAFLQANGWTPSELEGRLIADADKLAASRRPHEYVEDPDPDGVGGCTTCGAVIDWRDDNGELVHTNAPATLEDAIAEIEEQAPALAAFLAARTALDEAKASKGKGKAALVDVFEDCRADLVDDIARRLTDLIGPAVGEVLANFGSQESMATFLGDNGLGHFAGEISLDPKPHTSTRGTVRVVHLEEIVDALDRAVQDTFVEACQFADGIDGYFDLTDDEAVARLPLWIEDHELRTAELSRLYAVETGNREAIDRPQFRDALALALSNSTDLAEAG